MEVCEYCKNVGREDECSGKTTPNPCPYSVEINREVVMCDCCVNQQQRCHDDI